MVILSKNYISGQPARKLYFKYGFAETTGEIIHDKLGERVELSIIPGKIKCEKRNYI